MGRALKARPARSFLLFLLLPLAGCLEFELTSTVSWSPDGAEVAFVSGGKAWAYAPATGALRELPSPRAPTSLSWSPDGSLVAMAGAGRVELVSASSGAAAAGFALPSASTTAPVFLSWHPSGRRLLASELVGEGASTAELDLSSAAARPLGAGLAAYGPGGDWLLWIASAQFGGRTRMLFDRQTLSGEPLPLPAETAAVLEESEFDGGLTWLADGGARPLCVRAKVGERVEVSCLDASGRARRVARLPGDGSAFADPARGRFALVLEKEKERPRLLVSDARGRTLADGRRLVDAALGPFDADGRPARSKVTRLAWSPDSRLIAWVAGGRLCLWDWNKDEVKVVEPPAR